MDDTIRPTNTLRLSIRAAFPRSRAQAPEMVIGVAGDLDRCGAPELNACLSSMLGSAIAARLTVDLARTDFLDAGGLNVLISAARRAGSIGRPLRLVGCSRQALRLIHIVRAGDLFEAVAGPKQPDGARQRSPRTAHTDLPRGRSCTPHAADRPATTSRPRPRGAVTSMRGEPGIEQG